MMNPQIRFKMPDGSEFVAWKTCKLSSVLSEYNEKCEKDGTFEHVSLTQTGVVPKTDRYDRDFLVTHDDKQYRVTHLNDICYNPANLKFGVICRNKYGNGIFSPIYVTFRVLAGFDPVFIENYVTRFSFIQRALRYQQGTVYERMSVAPSDLLSIDVCVPVDINEQVLIAKFLGEIDKLIQSAEDELEATKRLKKAMLQKMFPNKGEKVPEVRFSGFTEDWEQRKVGELLTERDEQAPMSNEFPLMAFIANEGVAPKGERYDRSALVNDIAGKLYKKTKFGDFIYSSNNLEAGSIGLNKYGNASISPVYSIFEPTGIADSDFLGRYLVRKDFINAMVKWRQGVIYGQWRIHESDFIKIEIVVPSVEEQRQIGAFLDQLDTLIILHQRKCDAYRKFKKAMVQKMFV